MNDPRVAHWAITPSRLTRLVAQAYPLQSAHYDYGVTLARLERASARSAHQVVERYARYFRREFRYDFVPYDADEPYRPAATTAWLWICYDHDGVRVLGAGCCRYCTYTNCPESFWALQWVWLHPYARHQGLFTQAWPVLLAHHGTLFLEPPVAPAVQHVVAQTPTRLLHTTEGGALTLYLGTLAKEGVAMTRPRRHVVPLSTTARRS